MGPAFSLPYENDEAAGGEPTLQRYRRALSVPEGNGPIMATRQPKSSSFPRAKIARIVQGVLPKGKTFELRTADSGIREMKVVRIITPAWKNLRPPERLGKVLHAMDGQLSDAQRKRILRFSVLTPQEYQEVVVQHPPLRAVHVPATSGPKKLAAKRKLPVTRKRTASR